VADGQAVVAIGTDTGGSVRIPAALCGVVGYKPTAKRISRDGAIPLSTTLDSIGPLANSVACCAITDAVMAGAPAEAPSAATLTALRLGVPQTFALDDLEPAVASAFAEACAALSRAGAHVVDMPLTEFGEYPALSDRGNLVNSEAFAWHEDLIARRGNQYDPRVRSRIEFGRGVSAAAYIRLCAGRTDWIKRVAARTADFDALLMPTVAITAPPVSAFADDRAYFRLNGLILRNTSVINFLDRCAATLPIQPPGTAPVGLMVVGEHDGDRRLLAIARGIEAALAARR
jgi:aspartyl-tRNA(Asn)/glutamyl-tRNA(Gln) amidotransferase subunit A